MSVYIMPALCYKDKEMFYVLTYFNEKVQVKNVKMETLSIYPPIWSSPFLENVTNTNLTIL